MKVKTEMIGGGVKVITNKTHEISEFFYCFFYFLLEFIKNVSILKIQQII